MSGKDRERVAADRLRRTAEFFEPTVPTVKAPDLAETRRSRRWDSREENRLFHYRSGKDLHELAREAVEEYAAQGWQTTISAVIRGWALAGRELWLEGDVEVAGRAIVVESGTRGRTLG